MTLEMQRVQELLSQISAMTSGAPLTYTSMLVLFNRLTITLILRSADTNSNVRMTPSSRKCACYVRLSAALDNPGSSPDSPYPRPSARPRS